MTDLTTVDCLSTMDNWLFAYGRPTVQGKIKSQPEDFKVVEQMDVQPSGQGEHVWLLVRKSKQNTDQVSKHLARLANVAYRDVGYSGMKDYFAITEQWFSVWLPKGTEPDWQQFDLPGTEIIRAVRHSRKIKRGTHRANHFSIVVDNLLSPIEEARDALQVRLESIRDGGVPNYFGKQRFGRDANNILQAQQMLSGKKTIKDRNNRSILLSATRSWLFNTILSMRIDSASWLTLNSKLNPGEPANLDGSGSVFRAAGGGLENQRLSQLDIHPTAPMWGEYKTENIESYPDLHEFELAAIEPYADLASGLVAARVVYQRRPLRMTVADLCWQIEDEKLQLSFSLQKGQFATSVLRELVVEV